MCHNNGRKARIVARSHCKGQIRSKREWEAIRWVDGVVIKAVGEPQITTGWVCCGRHNRGIEGTVDRQDSRRDGNACKDPREGVKVSDPCDQF